MDEKKPSEKPESFRTYEDVYARYLGSGGLWSKSVSNAINGGLKSPPKLLWHYCSVSSFEGICRSGHLYLSDLDSMNDYREGRWLRDLIAQKVTDAARVFLPYLEASRIGFKVGPFVTSLSEDGDLLSQWRGYANGGRGTAIGLLSERLSVPVFNITDEQMPGYTAVCNVIYDISVQNVVVDAIVKIINGIVNELKGRSFPVNSHSFIPCSAYINMYLHYIEPVFKNPAFSEEKEWRIIHFPKSSAMDSWKDPSDLYLSDDHEADLLKFRTTTDDIVQYFSFPDDNALSSMIGGINLGPLNRMKDQPLALFLRKYGASDYKILRSAATLR